MEIDSKPKRVAVLDDHAIIAAGIGQLIDAEPEFELSGIYGEFAGLTEQLRRSPIDLLVMDLQLGGESIAPEIRELTYQFPALRILVFSFLDSKNYVHDAVAYGAMGFLSKSSPHLQLIDALKSLLSGMHFFGVDLGASVANADDAEIPVKLLSGRELEVLKRLALGFSPKEIGFELDLSDKTIHAHKNSIRQKLGLRRQSDLIRAAFSAGIVTVYELVG